MTATLMIIGHKVQHAMDPADAHANLAADADADAAGARRRRAGTTACSPIFNIGGIGGIGGIGDICEITQRPVVRTAAAVSGGYRVAGDNCTAARPAELFVLSFAGIAAARAWLHAVDGRELAGKTVLLMDPQGATAVAADGL